jgi:hypothetical protein
VATHILIRLSYPKQPGDTPWSIIDVDGPKSYVPVVEGDPGPPIVPATGGQDVFPSDFGMQSFHIVLAQGSTFASYEVVVIPMTVLPPGDDAFFVAKLMWFDIGDGTPVQVAAGFDLSKFSVRLLAIGN